MHRCIMDSIECHYMIEWHHALTYSGRQVNDWWAIAPLCTFHHRLAGKSREVMERSELWCLERATEHDLNKYGRSHWDQRKKYLIKKYETST